MGEGVKAMKLLILRLEGVLQSWGERSYWDHRDTAAFPTKSGVIGLLGCALGLERGDVRLARLAQTLTLAVRADRSGTVMTDFHTVQSRRGKFLNAEGKPRGDTILTPRGYLEDACFTVFLSGPEEALEACARALRSPKWVPCLGRRSCPPGAPLIPLLCEDYDSLEDAARRFVWARPPVRHPSKRMRYEVEDPLGPVDRTDQPLNASRNQYAVRHVRCGVRKEEAPCT